MTGVAEGAPPRASESEPFRISIPVPDSLAIEFDLALIDSATNDIIRVFHARAIVVIERHRRWHIADMAESPSLEKLVLLETRTSVIYRNRPISTEGKEKEE